MANLKLNKKGTLIEVKINSSGKEWSSLLDKSQKNLISNLEIKGFRKGNVPEDIAKKHIKENQIWNKAADLLIEKEYSKAIEILSKEKIATRPSFRIVSVSNDYIETVLSSIAMPEVKLGNRDEIKIKYKVNKVTQEEIDNEMKQLDSLLEKNEEINGPAINGDTLNIDFKGTVDGKEFDGGNSKGFDLKLGSKSFIEGFEEQLIGAKVKDNKTINVTFPKEYPSEEVKGKKAKFEVKINSVKRSIKLKGEELNKKLKTFGFESKDKIIEKIKEASAQRKVQDAKENFFGKYIDEISKLPDTKLTIPEEIVKSEVENEFQRVNQQVSQQGMKMEEYLKMLGMDENKFKKTTLVDSAKKRIKDGLIYQQLIHDLNVKVDDKDLEKEYNKIALDSKMKIEEVKKKINKDSIESNIMFNKLIKILIK